MTITPDTNVARIIAEALARTMRQAAGDEAVLPVVEEVAPASARYVIETPLGEFRVTVTAL